MEISQHLKQTRKWRKIFRYIWSRREKDLIQIQKRKMKNLKRLIIKDKRWHHRMRWVLSHMIGVAGYLRLGRVNKILRIIILHGLKVNQEIVRRLLKSQSHLNRQWLKTRRWNQRSQKRNHLQYRMSNHNRMQNLPSSAWWSSASQTNRNQSWSQYSIKKNLKSQRQNVCRISSKLWLI